MSYWPQAPLARRVLLLAVLATSRAPLQFQFPSENERSDFETLYYREGPLATTKVYVDPTSREKHMSVDGIVIGGTGNTEFKQLLLDDLDRSQRTADQHDGDHRQRECQRRRRPGPAGPGARQPRPAHRRRAAVASPDRKRDRAEQAWG